MNSKIIEINEEEVKNHLGEFVRETVEETLNAMLEAEAEQLLNAHKHERRAGLKGYRAGHYDRKLLTKAGEVTLQMPKLKKVTFESAIIERYKRREISVEEAMVEMYLAGVSVRRDREVAKHTALESLRLCVSRRDMDEAFLGWRSTQCLSSGCDRRQRGRVPED